MQYHENVKLSTRDSEECTGHEKIQVFTVAANPRSKKFDGSPIFASHRSAHFFGLFFVSGRVSSRYDEEYFILRMLYCYSLQQLIFLAFCNDFDKKLSSARIYSSQKHNIVIPEMTSEGNSTHSPLFLGREHGNVQNYKL